MINAVKDLILRGVIKTYNWRHKETCLLIPRVSVYIEGLYNGTKYLGFELTFLRRSMAIEIRIKHKTENYDSES